MANQYLRALLQRKMVCKSREERGQLCHRLLQDATQLRELFCSLVRGAGCKSRGIASSSCCPPAAPRERRCDTWVVVRPAWEELAGLGTLGTITLPSSP